MTGNGKLLTIKEASEFAGVTESYLYKLIRKGAMSFEPGQNQDRTSPQGGQNQFKTIKMVKEADIISFFNLSEKQRTEPGQNQDSPEDRTRTELQDTIKEVIENYFQGRETKLMKPLEEIATYKLGQVETENKFLKEKLETVLQENEELRAGMKALPGPPVEVATRLEELEEQNKTLVELEEGQKAELAESKEREDIKEKEIEKLKEKLKVEEKEKEKLAKIWAKELEEERNRPWWKKIF